MTFKAVAYIAAGVVAGFALGGIPARRELAALRAERDTLQAKLEDLSRPNLLGAFLPGLRDADGATPGRDGIEGAARAVAPAAGTTTSAGAAEQAAARPAPQGDVAVIGAADPKGASSASARPGDRGAAAEAAQSPANPGAPERAADGSERRRERPRGRDMLARFDQLVTAQRARIAAARSALIEQAELDEQELARVDTAVTRMNGKLAGYGEEVIAQAASEEPPSPAQALGLGHDVSGILYEGQKELDAVVGEKSEDVDSSALEIWNYVDLEQWRPYVESQLAAQQSGKSDKPQPSGDPAASGGKAGSGAATPAASE